MKVFETLFRISRARYAYYLSEARDLERKGFLVAAGHVRSQSSFWLNRALLFRERMLAG